MMIVSPWIVRPPAFAEAMSSTGFSRTVTVELLLMKVLSAVGDTGNAIGLCYVKLPAQATDDTLGAQSDARPGGHAKWVQIPHGLATVSGEPRSHQFLAPDISP